MLGKMIKVFFNSLFHGKASIGWRITQAIAVILVLFLAYQRAMVYVEGTRDNAESLNAALSQCVEARKKDKDYQQKLESVIKEYEGRLANGQEKIVLLEKPPPPVDDGLLDNVKTFVQNTTSTFKENVDVVKSKVFTDRRVGFGYLGSFTGAGMAHGAYIRYDILSIWGKSLNVGAGATYGRYRERSFMGMPPQTRSDFNFVVMGGFEL